MKVSGQRGVVLIVVLWITVLLTVLLVAFTATIKVDREVATDIVQRVQARASAEAVLSYLVAVRKSATYNWSEMTGEIYKLSLNAMQVRFRFVPEESFVSLNAVPMEELEQLLSAAGAQNATTLAEYIVLRRQGGVDPQTGEEIEAKPWASPIELSRLPGVSPEVYRHIEGWFTVDSNHSAVALAFAEADLIRALKGAQAEQILADRATQERTQSTSGFFGFDQAADSVMRVQVELSSTANKRKIEISVVFDGSELGYRIVRWNEYNARFSLE